jgi:hypothetical protein
MWRPIYLTYNDYVNGSFIKRNGFYLVNTAIQQIDIRECMTKKEAQLECDRRNTESSSQLDLSFEEK